MYFGHLACVEPCQKVFSRIRGVEPELLDATISAEHWGKIFEDACTLWATYCPLFNAYIILDNYPDLEKALREATADLVDLVRRAGFLPTSRLA